MFSWGEKKERNKERKEKAGRKEDRIQPTLTVTMGWPRQPRWGAPFLRKGKGCRKRPGGVSSPAAPAPPPHQQQRRCATRSWCRPVLCKVVLRSDRTFKRIPPLALSSEGMTGPSHSGSPCDLPAHTRLRQDAR